MTSRLMSGFLAGALLTIPAVAKSQQIVAGNPAELTDEAANNLVRSAAESGTISACFLKAIENMQKDNPGEASGAGAISSSATNGPTICAIAGNKDGPTEMSFSVGTTQKMPMIDPNSNRVEYVWRRAVVTADPSEPTGFAATRDTGKYLNGQPQEVEMKLSPDVAALVYPIVYENLGIKVQNRLVSLIK